MDVDGRVRLGLKKQGDTISVSSTDFEGQGGNRRVNLRDLVPKLDIKNADINLFFEIFERQAKKEKVAEDRWVSQLIPLLPMEIAEIVVKEPPEIGDDYPHIKNLLLARFQLTPVALRDKFESHQRRPGAMWADLVFELRSYLDNWLVGMRVDSFDALKELLVTEQIKKRAPSDLFDHFLDTWDSFKEAKSLAQKLDHFEAIKRVHKKPGLAKTWYRRTYDKPSLESKNKLANFSGKGRNVGSLNRDSIRHEVSHGSSQIRREGLMGSESQFEKRKPIICYYCNEAGHIKPACPRLRKNNFETVANLNVNTGDEDPFKNFKVNMEINGVDRVCLRDSGSAIDVCARSWINENDLLGEYVWVKSPLDEVCHCLPLAKIKITTKRGEFYTKAAIKQDKCDFDMYILGNRTAELIEASDQGVQLINAVVTRSKGICPSLERGKETSDGVLNENRAKLAEFVSPPEGEENDSLEIPAFEEGGEMSLAELKGSEFIEEQRKCLDLKQLWDKAQTEGDTEFKIIRGRLVRVARTRRGEEIRQLCSINRRSKRKIKKEKIAWDEKCEKAFEELKSKLVSQPILFAPDFSKDFILQTDASEVGAGVVLSQRIGEEEHPIVFLSKKFSKAERNYSTVERELAAIILV
ncbi:integrase_H2C2 domain-containing protein [Trichonephila clavata]|uniref:Integrase_H2C2 domain-containing protein n=1 Tax=Trichonephila clavata TaxID=2740835 RepID=A0A8X6FGH5_TRICU|nr:integrase_H2C2 domain-containing protein [Trichonephila clavata]